MIDFHTHIFPKKIAADTISLLASKYQSESSFDGTKEGLIASASKAGIDCSILLPVVTKPEQFESVNRFAAQFQKAPLISFGGIHPNSEHYKKELKTIKELGLKGIKLHPDYQGVFIDDIRYKRIISYASELELIISVHAGVDPGFPDCVHCTPQRASQMMKDVQPETLVLAHLGGFLMWDDVEAHLVGKHVFLDASVLIESISDEQFVRIIRNHGVKKILFATDAPWADQSEFVAHMQRLPLTEEEKQLVFHDNATALLQL